MVHPIQDGRIRLDRREGEETGSPGKTTKTAATELAGAHGLGEPVHQITRDRYGSKENHEANSPRATSRVEANRGWRAARGGGRRKSAKFGSDEQAILSEKKMKDRRGSFTRSLQNSAACLRQQFDQWNDEST